MRSLSIILLLLAFAVSACAENASEAPSSEALQATPPGIMGTLGAGSADTAFAKAAEADATSDLFTLRTDLIEAAANRSLSNLNVRVSMDDGNNRLEITTFVGSDSLLSLSLKPSEWVITLMADFPSTDGKDYYGVFGVLLNADKNMTVFLQPVGSVRGEVFDDEGMLVSGARMKFMCSGGYGATDQSYTDQFGSFSADWLPVGPCKISALSNGKAGFLMVNVTQGILLNAKINLEQRIIISEPDSSWIFEFIVVVAAIVAGIIFLRSRPMRLPKQETVVTPSKRMSDLLSVMDDNERRIMESLMASAGRSLQSKLGKELGIPKASLSRALGGLEARGLVKTERLGRVNKIELAPWFLNGKSE